MTSKEFNACYEPLFPANLGDGFADLPEFIKKFYQVSDTPGRDDEWVSFFAEDSEAHLVMGSKRADGKEGKSHVSVALVPG